MANIKSQIKRIKTNEKAHQRNKAVKSELRTQVRKFREAVESGNVEEATVAMRDRLPQAGQGRVQGRHPQEPGREPQVGDRQAPRRAGLGLAFSRLPHAPGAGSVPAR